MHGGRGEALTGKGKMEGEGDKGKLEQKIVNYLHTRRRTNREFRLNANIGDFNTWEILY